MAAAFALVVVVVGIVPLMRSGTTPIGDAPETTFAPVTTMQPGVTTTALAPDDCSARGMTSPSAQPGLPPVVAEVREGIIGAAIACDWETLSSYAAPGFVFTYGGGGFDEMRRSGSLQLLVQMLGTPFAALDYEEGNRIFVWPSAFSYESWEEIPPEDLEALDPIYKEDLFEVLAPAGVYLGWRVGITERGEWLYFVAGD